MARHSLAYCLLGPVYLAVAACGGGSDGGGGGNIRPPAVSAEITSQSAPVVAETVARSILGGQNLSALGGLSIPASSSSASSGGGAPPIAALSVGPEVVECAAGGSVTLSGDVGNSTMLTAGDTFEFDYTDCDQGEGTVVDGRMRLTVVTFTPGASEGSFSVTLTMLLTDLQYVEDGIGGSMNGDLTFSLDASSQLQLSMSISSDSLTATYGDASETIEDYILTIDIDPFAGTLALQSSGTTSSSRFTGVVDFQTTEPIAFAASGAPVSGRIVITGANNGTVTVDIVGETQVDLEIDFDGNGTIDEVVSTTWADLID